MIMVRTEGLGMRKNLQIYCAKSCHHLATAHWIDTGMHFWVTFFYLKLLDLSNDIVDVSQFAAVLHRKLSVCAFWWRITLRLQVVSATFTAQRKI